MEKQICCLVFPNIQGEIQWKDWTGSFSPTQKTLKELLSLSGSIVLNDNRSTFWHGPVTSSSHIYDAYHICPLNSGLPDPVTPLGMSHLVFPGHTTFICTELLTSSHAHSGPSLLNKCQLTYLITISSPNSSPTLQIKLVGPSFETEEHWVSTSIRNTCLLL